MSTPADDDDIERALESMAQFDRQQASVDAAPEAVDVDLSSGEREEILRRVSREFARGGPDDAPPETLTLRPRSNRWIAVAASVGLGLAAALLLWIFSAPVAPAPGDGVGSVAVAPHRVELGGTARVLGDVGAGPRAYGPGDDFVLRVVPLSAARTTEVPARLFVLSDGGRRRLDLPKRRSDGTIEFFGKIAETLPPGVWILRTELGSPDACVVGREGCLHLDVTISIIDG